MPAAAVIPASLVYIKAVVVEKFVVGFLLRTTSLPIGSVFGLFYASPWGSLLCLTVRCLFQANNLEEIGVSQASFAVEHTCMEWSTMNVLELASPERT